MSKPKYNFTPLWDSYDVVLKTLVTKKIITLLEISRHYELEEWNNDHYYDYHRNKGHKTKNCIELKHKVQDIINDGIVYVETSKDLSNGDGTIDWYNDDVILEWIQIVGLMYTH